MTDTQAAPAASAQSTGRLLTALIVGGITAILDTTIVAIGLHTLTTALHAPISTIQWVSTGYLLALAVAIPFVSWAQARFGGKRLWLFALGLFVLGSALCRSEERRVGKEGRSRGARHQEGRRETAQAGASSAV